ncbi:hypothetical protein [Bifidobacterium avesanii]|nr:hypothetical protein [Bifidobacterium avesanii]
MGKRDGRTAAPTVRRLPVMDHRSMHGGRHGRHAVAAEATGSAAIVAPVA